MSASTRWDDARLLVAIKMRTAGKTPAEIARVTQWSPDYIRAATTRVRRADQQESGEDIAGGYW